jgi:hypothetical protein
VPQSTIYLSDASKAIDFGGRSIAREEQENPGTFPATMTHTDGYETFIHRMRCRPAP